MSIVVTNINEMEKELALAEKKVAELKENIDKAKKEEFLSSLKQG